MLHYIKASDLTAITILLSLGLHGHYRNMVEGGVLVEVVKHTEVNENENVKGINLKDYLPERTYDRSVVYLRIPN